jgi:hypothetical protein
VKYNSKQTQRNFLSETRIEIEAERRVFFEEAGTGEGKGENQKETGRVTEFGQ